MDIVAAKKAGRIKEVGRFPVHDQIDSEITKAVQKSFLPHLIGEHLSYFEAVEGDVRNHVHADYLCYTILPLVEVLRSKHPCFKNASPVDIAKVIMSKFQTSHIIKDVNLHDVGFLSFNLSGDWIAEIIRKNLKGGIAAWAPVFLPKKVLLVASPDAGDDLRPYYITDTMQRLLGYTGVEVCHKLHNQHQRALQIVKSFPEDMQQDLMALWCGQHVQKANSIWYVVPVRQREYILKCFDAAKDFMNKKQTSMVYFGYRETSVNEEEKLAVLWDTLFSHCLDFPAIHNLNHACQRGESLGYSPEEFLECTIRYEYLKKFTYSGCIIEVEKIFGTEINNFLNLLDTHAEIRRVIRHRRPNLESNKALVGRERELGLHLLQFTEIISKSTSRVMPHLLCEYLYNLSKDFTSFIHQTEPSETQVLLCKAAEVVMEKGFELLGITPGSLNSRRLRSLRLGERIARDHDIALPDLRSRFEIFSMYVEVFPSVFKNGYLFGDVIVSDEYGAAHPDKWCGIDKNGWGKVAYFDHSWYDPISIRSSSSFLPLPFGDPASRFSLPFFKSIKIDAHLWVTSEEKDIVYQICNVESEQAKIETDDFLRSEDNIKATSFNVECGKGYGFVNFHSVLIKEAVDTLISLRYEPLVDHGHPARVFGYIRAYYGGKALDSCSGYNKNYYKAMIFQTGPTILLIGNLMLNKSTLAVPKDGLLVFEALFEDAETGNIIVRDKFEFSEERERAKKNSNWIIGDETFRFILKVDWIRGRLPSPQETEHSVIMKNGVSQQGKQM